MMVSVPLNKVDIISSPPQYMDVDLKNVLNNMFQAIGQEISLTSFLILRRAIIYIVQSNSVLTRCKIRRSGMIY